LLVTKIKCAFFAFLLFAWKESTFFVGHRNKICFFLRSYSLYERNFNFFQTGDPLITSVGYLFLSTFVRNTQAFCCCCETLLIITTLTKCIEVPFSTLKIFLLRSNRDVTAHVFFNCIGIFQTLSAIKIASFRIRWIGFMSEINLDTTRREGSNTETMWHFTNLDHYSVWLIDLSNSYSVIIMTRFFRFEFTIFKNLAMTISNFDCSRRILSVSLATVGCDMETWAANVMCQPSTALFDLGRIVITNWKTVDSKTPEF